MFANIKTEKNIFHLNLWAGLCLFIYFIIILRLLEEVIIGDNYVE